MRQNDSRESVREGFPSALVMMKLIVSFRTTPTQQPPGPRASCTAVRLSSISEAKVGRESSNTPSSSASGQPLRCEEGVPLQAPRS